MGVYYYQEEHFARMSRIRDNLPGRNLLSTMPIWTLWENMPQVAGQPGFIQYRHPNEPFVHVMDPVSAGATFPCRMNEEGNIMMPLRQEYDEQWLWNMEDANTANVFDEVLTAPVLEQGWCCDNGAPVDVEGYPLTQYYAKDNVCMQEVGPGPAFFLINQEMPTDSVPSNIVLQRWPTGPDQRIVELNPLY
eukprot:scaffold22852_cov63-Attheya_sp.AAC.2